MDSENGFPRAKPCLDIRRDSDYLVQLLEVADVEQIENYTVRLMNFHRSSNAEEYLRMRYKSKEEQKEAEKH